jgi:Ca2+/H+ antiporter
MLGLSVLAIVIPAAFSTSLDSLSANGVTTVGEAAGTTPETELSNLLKISRGTAIMLLFCYAAYLFFVRKPSPVCATG